MFCWIRNVWGIQWTESKVKIIEQKPVESSKFLYHAFMVKYTSKTMDMID